MRDPNTIYALRLDYPIDGDWCLEEGEPSTALTKSEHRSQSARRAADERRWALWHQKIGQAEHA